MDNSHQEQHDPPTDPSKPQNGNEIKLLRDKDGNHTDQLSPSTPPLDDSIKTQGLAQEFTPDSEPAQEPGEARVESLFETYDRRSVSEIIATQNALKESQASEAAAVILDDAEPIVFDEQLEHAIIESNNPERSPRRIRVQTTSPLGQLFSPGAQFVYALIIITLLGGLIGLASTIHSPMLVLIAGIASPLLLPVCVWKWIRWLDSAPYYYRLLTSLGEDARNLLNIRLFWKQ
jgi:hypothetical protein